MNIQLTHNSAGSVGSFADQDTTGFPARIGQVADLAGGNVALARLCSVSESVVRKWRRGESQPVTSHLVAMARAGGVSVEWLATGQGAMRPGDAQPAPLAAGAAAIPQGVTDGSRAAYAAHGGVRSAVTLAVSAIGDRVQDIGPERLADIVDAAHHLLEAGADPAIVRRLIAASAAR